MAANANLILIVDDDAYVHEHLDRVFARLAIREQRVHAHTGAEAIDLLTQLRANGGPPFLMLLDLKMPGVDGFGVLEWMNEQRLTETRVVVLSGFLTKEGCSRAYQLGAYSCFDKYPDDEDVLSLYDVAKAAAVRGEKQLH